MTINSRTTLIFDGECGFCTACVDWFRARMRKAVKILPLQSINPEDYGLTLDDVQREAWWITGQQRYGGHRAVAQALKACNAPWPCLGFMLDTVPLRWISRLGYRWVARNRGRLPGALPACRTEKQPPNDGETAHKHG